MDEERDQSGDLADLAAAGDGMTENSPPEESKGSKEEAEDQVEIKAEKEDGSGTTATHNPKTYKTVICQYYLQGPCKNGDSCVYAHGTSELRKPGGSPVSATKAASGKGLYKTILCTKFVTQGFCTFGDRCHFAHGSHEIRMAGSEGATGPNPSGKPNYKSALCKNYMQFGHCAFAAKCQFAHGPGELQRPTPGVVSGGGVKNEDPGGHNLTEEERKAKLEKLQKIPGYRTKLCQNKENCEYGDLCLFAHSKDDLREESSGSGIGSSTGVFSLAQFKARKAAAAGAKIVDPTIKIGEKAVPENYKTTLCKNYTSGTCKFGPECQFAHGQKDLRIMGNALYKTQLCQNMMKDEFCPKGDDCIFAHSFEEQRSSGSFTPAFGVVQVPGQPPKYKTAMCKSMLEEGMCVKGSECHFAHSEPEKLAGRKADPKFKTVLCKSFAATGSCPKEADACIFAHGERELKPRMFDSDLNSPFGGMSGPGGASGLGDPRYKTKMCTNFPLGNCTRGAACHFAHSQLELRSPGAGMGPIGKPSPMGGRMPGSYGSVGPMGQAAPGSYGSVGQMGQAAPAARGPGYLPAPHPSEPDLWRSGPSKRPLPSDAAGPSSGGGKTMLCQNYLQYGVCAMQDMCLYAHSQAELMTPSSSMTQFNKRQRF